MNTPSNQHTAFLALGANLGDPLAQCEAAVSALRAHHLIEVVAASAWRWYPALTLEPNDEQPEYCNGVLQIATSIGVEELLTVCKYIEHSMGRVRSVRWASRPIDIDILSYDAQILDLPEVTIPHPELHKRMFVLEPLAEIAPGWVHPVLGLTATQLKEQVCSSLSTVPTSKKSVAQKI